MNDRIEPGVYVDIQDNSYVAATTSLGRTVFMAGLCDMGPHNRVVSVTSLQDFQKKFGKPNFNRTSQSHYNMDKAMQYTNKGLYIRVVPFDAKVANVLVVEDNYEAELFGDFVFVQAPKDIKKKPFPEDFPNGSLDGNYINAKNEFEAYKLLLNESKKVITHSEEAYNELYVGDWIFAGAQNEPQISADDKSVARQIVSKIWYADESYGVLILNNGYAGLPYIIGGNTVDWGQKTASSCFKYIQYKSVSDGVNFKWNVQYDTLDLDSKPECLYAMWATGAGARYNRLRLKGVRNTELEKMYTDDNTGDVLYKYMFMNIGIYEENDDGSTKLLEGPWPVSLYNRTSDGRIIRDLSSGRLLYIEDIVNEESELIRLKSGPKVENLILPEGDVDEEVAERNRLNLMLLLSVNTFGGSFVPLANSILKFDNGYDGHADYSEFGDTPRIPLYKNGKLQIAPQIEELIGQAYRGTMESVDGTIEQLREVVYPYFSPDYIVTGGFSSTIQNAGRELAEIRSDCIHLADTGYRTSYEADINARQNYYNWNNWTSVLYTQYRQIRDPYTGEKMKINPCYHAIERHLIIDDKYFIGEPVANIEKGAINEPITLVYKANHTERGELINYELNPIIVEPQGTYILTQLTTWKRLSILKRVHAAKFTAFVKKMIPPLLKDILQRKATTFWINRAKSVIDTFMSKYIDQSTERYHILSEYSVNVSFDETASELNVLISMKPLRVIERINVMIIVQ